ncbi:endonuclease/exonuclease/phosphatase family protein [Natrinema salifodinae]|uniref:3-phytase/alkaline phosphatase D n=1 Tax=Natrinema salifodinae TaxID=1202768 RepID=A0A1I0MLA9_9EURY|nr:endonuclease/exonuclease/phosphatase family protein [Natrinema salifodinae]SEV89075.1 3-phytase/alkaline phosphatase D [Natrinema salifodinae]
MVNGPTRRRFLTATGTTVAATGLLGTASGAGPGDRKGKETNGSKPTPVRYAAFNVMELETEQVQEPGDDQAQAAARIVQEVRPDVLVVNELTNNVQEGEYADRTNIEAFVENYLSVPQRDDLEGIEYPHTVQPESNTGVLPEEDFDFNKDGQAGQRPGDAFGFGEYPGHYAFAIASRYPIREDDVRSFRKFRWTDMPDNLLLTEDEAGEDAELYLTPEEQEVYRLSSKTHIDVPFDVDGDVVHGLFAHPTPPTFDGPENFNGRWNHDEVRFFADYVAGADYIYDDDGTAGGLDDDASYVLMGDMNADPNGDRPLDPATKFLFDNEDFETRRLPTSPGGAQRGNPSATRFGGDFEGVVEGIDYVLPSPDLSLRGSSVVWPSDDANKRGLADDVETASDHRLVWADIAV